jgi:hypothetical protein
MAEQSQAALHHCQHCDRLFKTERELSHLQNKEDVSSPGLHQPPKPNSSKNIQKPQMKEIMQGIKKGLQQNDCYGGNH